MKQRRALLLEDGASRGALAAVRSLGRAGWHVGVGAPHRGPAAVSRWCATWHRVTGAELDPETFVADAEVASRGYDLILPCGDAETLLVSQDRSRFGGVLPYPPHDVVARAFDKLALGDAAHAAGVAVPRTRPATDAAEAETAYPVVVKPRTRNIARGGHVPYGTLAADRESLRACADAIRRAGAEPLLQEHIPGPLAALTTLRAADGGVVAHAYQLADATWPPQMGGSVRARTADVPPDVAEAVDSLLGRLGWFGLAQVQFIRAADGTHRLIDVNGRLYGSIALAIAAGADFPRLWADAAPPRDPPVVARAGVRYHALEGDVRRLVAERRAGDNVVRYAVGAVHALWRRDDPLPALRRIAALATNGGAKTVRAFRR